MNFTTFESISEKIKNQIENVRTIWIEQLGETVLGIYVHGSLALNCFVEKSSDIDIIIVTNERISKEERLDIASKLIKIDGKPCPLEMSAIWINDLIKEEYPVKCQFHYSDYWRDSYNRILKNELESNYILDNDFEDSDIASYIQVLNQNGICIYGESIDKVFPNISPEIFWESISNDIDNYKFDAYKPRYFVSNILILGRILSYKKEKKVLSKYDGAYWMLKYVPIRFQYIVENAIKVWFMDDKAIEYKQDDLSDLLTFLVGEIKR